MLNHPPRQARSISPPRGFTLIEMMVALAILAFLLLAGVPGYQTWIANTRIRTAAESIQNGLMLAKNEAIKRNARVQFILTISEPVTANINSLAENVNGTNWMVRVFQSSGTYTAADFVQGRSNAEGSQGTTVAAGQASFVFDGLGRLNPIPAATVNINLTRAGGDRALRITVSTGGAIRMCDPALSLNNTPLGC